VLLSLLGCQGLPQDVFQSQIVIEAVNSANSTWRAGVNSWFNGLTLRQVRQRMGVILDEEKRLRAALPVVKYPAVKDLPDSFDARLNWPECADVIGNIRDQSACGSCWAVAAAGAMSDRMCISSKAQTKLSISAGDLMSCCQTCGYGCDGGFPSAAWSYFHNTGLVTGSNYTLRAGCKPYPLAPCEHHNNATTYKPCPAQEYDTPRCKRECQSGYNSSYNSDKHHATSSYAVDSTVSSIQQDIMQFGSVEAAYTVYSDFPSYKSGVYKHTSGSYLGGHAVRVIGWGTENNTPYWLIANSWNTDWGDNGYFKILRGADECGIESGIVAGKV